eukprot:CAMPEP_0180594072 /NCGR_PEP_ID=MMETSP1037_2-20121125/20584_1 /TAXON_ID=632150 /ORGANISM="Azadinium spinosum, Strain 3D9" /LENGTH=582 /DNA_ID=CAMNT_0022612485 /DNA_START=24 /DNA_END=1772 /DNA_ORIENTATION=-
MAKAVIIGVFAMALVSIATGDDSADQVLARLTAEEKTLMDKAAELEAADDKMHQVLARASAQKSAAIADRKEAEHEKASASSEEKSAANKLADAEAAEERAKLSASRVAAEKKGLDAKSSEAEHAERRVAAEKKTLSMETSEVSAEKTQLSQEVARVDAEKNALASKVANIEHPEVVAQSREEVQVWKSRAEQAEQRLEHQEAQRSVLYWGLQFSGLVAAVCLLIAAYLYRSTLRSKLFGGLREPLLADPYGEKGFRRQESEQLAMQFRSEIETVKAKACNDLVALRDDLAAATSERDRLKQALRDAEAHLPAHEKSEKLAMQLKSELQTVQAKARQAIHTANAEALRANEAARQAEQAHHAKVKEIQRELGEFQGAKTNILADVAAMKGQLAEAQGAKGNAQAEAEKMKGQLAETQAQLLAAIERAKQAATTQSQQRLSTSLQQMQGNLAKALASDQQVIERQSNASSPHSVASPPTSQGTGSPSPQYSSQSPRHAYQARASGVPAVTPKAQGTLGEGAAASQLFGSVGSSLAQYSTPSAELLRSTPQVRASPQTLLAVKFAPSASQPGVLEPASEEIVEV